MWRKRFPFAHPVSRAEVHGFSKVVALVEAAMVSSGEGYHKLSRTLIGPIDLERLENLGCGWQDFVNKPLG